MLRRAFAVTMLTVVLLFYGSGCQSDPDLLAPHQVDDSMLEEVVKVKGKITLATENPGGLGGIYLKLSNSKGEVYARIQKDIWDEYEESDKAGYKEGRTVTVEGVLFKAGAVLVVIHGKYTLSSNATSTSTVY